MKKYGVIVASHIEYNTIARASGLKPCGKAAYRAGVCYSGGNLYYVIQSGVGCHKAASCTKYLIKEYNVDEIINIGIAGGLDEYLNIGSVVLCDSVSGSDWTESLTCSPRIKKHEKIFKDRALPVTTGSIVTTDKVITNHTEKAALKTRYNALACEMEAAGVLKASAGIPVTVIKVISDFADEKTLVDAEIINSNQHRIMGVILKTILKKPRDTISRILRMRNNLKVALDRVTLVMKCLLDEKE